MRTARGTAAGGEHAGGEAPDGFATPVVVVSKCLEFDAVRYDGDRISYDFVRHLEPFVRFVPVCPEVEIGLGVPRDPVRLVRSGEGDPGSGRVPAGGGDGEDAGGGGHVRMLQPATGRDVTAEMVGFARDFLDGLGPVDGFLLKNRSPSCGTGDVKVYAAAENAPPVGRGPGLFAREVLERFPDLAVENEGRLRNFRIREHFLTLLFALADLRRVESSGEMREMVGFHTRYKLVLMAYDQEAMRTLGRVVANPEDRAFGELVRRYREGFAEALSAPPRYTAMINVLEHAAGHFKEELSGQEKRFFQDSLRRYREGRVPVSAVTALVRSWAVRFSSDWLLRQTLFRPYPEELVTLSDSGKGGPAR